MLPYTTLFRSHPHRLLHARGGPRGGDAPAAWDVCLMRYRVVAVGRVKHAALRAACDDYLERLRHYTRIERSEEHTSELQSHSDLVCRLLLEKKNKDNSQSLQLCYVAFA